MTPQSCISEKVAEAYRLGALHAECCNPALAKLSIPSKQLESRAFQPSDSPGSISRACRFLGGSARLAKSVMHK